jgi:peptidoglycan hydrolase-like protein with peptidoglycan-binding domain
MTWIALIPLVIQGLTAIQPALTGANPNSVTTAGNGLIPLLESLIAVLAPSSKGKVAPAVAAATSVFDPNLIKWIQQILNLAGFNVDVDGELGPQTLGAAAAFAEKELGIVQGSPAGEILQNALKWLATKAP